MARRANRWQLVLFLAAVLVPSAVLVAVSQRTIQQNRELAGKRRLDERRALRERLAADLLKRAEKLKATPAAPVLSATVEAGRLIPPWESDSGLVRFRERTAQPQFAAAVARGERAQFADKQPAAAVREFREAIGLARDPLQETYARLLLARALKEANQEASALAEARRVARAPLPMVDEDGIPLRVHAVSLLAASPVDREAVLQALSEVAAARSWPSPLATVSLSNLAGQLDVGWFRAWVAKAVRVQEQFQTLQSDAERLGLLTPRAAPVWTYVPAAEPWLVSTVEAGGAVRVVVLSAAALLEPVEKSAGVHFLPPAAPGGELVGDSFPALKVRFDQPDDATPDARLQTAIYYAALFALVGAAMFGSWLLWRSLRREVELADTRAQFVASVSHELKTPLTAIRMFAETLQMGRPLEDSVRAEYLETIVNESERLTRLVDDVLLFSRIEQGRKVFRARPVSLPEILRTAVRTLSYPLAQNQFRVNLEIDEAVPEVKGDADALEQAVLNLLANAVKYSGESRDIGLRLRRETAEAVVDVTDHGIGIAPEEQPRVFEKYYRVAAKQNEAIPGAGLGLALVAQIARAHGGRVELESTLGKGSTFSIRLPLGNGHERHIGD